MPTLKLVSGTYAALSGLVILYVLGAMVFAATNRSSGGFVNFHLEDIFAYIGLAVLAVLSGIGLLGAGAGTAAALLIEEQRALLGWWLALGGLFTAELLGAGLGWLILPSL